MSARRPIPPDIQHRVLDRSRRRCALCIHFDSDWTQKEGQIAHLDQDPSNFLEDNLAFLCLQHHDDYDTRRRQTKNLNLTEVKTARDRLYKFVESGGDFKMIGEPKIPNIYERQVEILSELMGYLDDACDFLQHTIRRTRFSEDLSPEQCQLKCMKAVASAQNLINQRRLLIPPELINLSNVFFCQISQALADYALAQDPMVSNGHQRAGFWDEAAKTAQETLPSTLRSIEQISRSMVHGKQPTK